MVRILLFIFCVLFFFLYFVVGEGGSGDGFFCVFWECVGCCFGGGGGGCGGGGVGFCGVVNLCVNLILYLFFGFSFFNMV